MTNEEIIQYYDYLIRLATSKCNSQNDAEDLVGDTMLAAFAYMHRGGTIEHPKTWLTNTLYHKHNDNLRKKYRAPVTVCLDESIEVAEEQDDEYFTSEEASRIRKELNHLSFITREVLIRFYFGNQSVSDIAEGLGTTLCGTRFLIAPSSRSPRFSTERKTITPTMNGGDENGRLTAEGRKIEMNKIRTLFRIALANGHDSMVLGAFGCGVYHLDCDDVAGLFRDILDEPLLSMRGSHQNASRRRAGTEKLLVLHHFWTKMSDYEAVS